MVEWPDRAPGLGAQADLSLQLDYDGEGRQAELRGLSDRGKAVVQAIATA
jgi:tRNA threonylcarbamoyladenosine biosynthesis protein TsaE